MARRSVNRSITYCLALQGQWSLPSQGWKRDGEIAGNNQNLVATALKIKLTGQSNEEGSVRYQVLPTNSSQIGFDGDFTPWTWKRDGEQAGNNEWQLQSIRIKLEADDTHDVHYRVFEQNSGWLPWQTNGGLAGYSNKGKVVGLQVKLVTKSG